MGYCVNPNTGERLSDTVENYGGIYESQGTCEGNGYQWVEESLVDDTAQTVEAPITRDGFDIIPSDVISLDSIVEAEKEAVIDGLIAEQEAEDSKTVMNKGGLEDMFKTVTDNDNDLEKISGETLDGGKFEFKNNRPNKDAKNNQITASTPFVAGTTTEGKKEAATGTPEAVTDFLSGGDVQQGEVQQGEVQQGEVQQAPITEQDIAALLPTLEPTIDPTLDPLQAQIGQPVDDSKFVETMDRQLNDQGLNEQMMVPTGGPEETPLDLTQAFAPEEVLESPEDVIASQVAPEMVDLGQEEVITEHAPETVDLSEEKVLEIVESPELATANLEQALVNTGEIDNPVTIEAVNDFVAKVDEVAQALADGSIELLSDASNAAKITAGAGVVTLAEAGDWVVDEAGNAIDEAGAIIAEAGDWVENAAGELESAVSEGIDSASETAGELIASAGEWMETDGGELVDQAGNVLAEAGEWLLDTAGNAVMAVVGAPVVAAGAVIDGVTDLFSSEEGAEKDLKKMADGGEDKDATSWISDLMAGFTELTGITSQEIMRALVLYAGSRLFGYSPHDSAEFAFKGFAEGVQDGWTAQMKDHQYYKKEQSKILAKYKGDKENPGYVEDMASLDRTVGNDSLTLAEKLLLKQGQSKIDVGEHEDKTVIDTGAHEDRTTIDTRAKGDETSEKKVIEYQEVLRGETDRARKTQANSSQFRRVLEESEIGTGKFLGNLRQSARTLASELLGIETEEAASGELIMQKTLESMLLYISDTKGAISNAEMDQFRKASAGLHMTPAGIRLILETADRFADNDIRRNKAINDWIAKVKREKRTPSMEGLESFTHQWDLDNRIELPTSGEVEAALKAKHVEVTEVEKTSIDAINNATSADELRSIVNGMENPTDAQKRAAMDAFSKFQ